MMQRTHATTTATATGHAEAGAPPEGGWPRVCHEADEADEWEDEPFQPEPDDEDAPKSVLMRQLLLMQRQLVEEHFMEQLQCTPLGAWRMRQAKRASEAAEGSEIAQLETKTLSSEACTECEGVCAVCQCEWEEGDEVRVLPCGHHFHTGCVDQWLGKHRACCPLCKADVRPAWDDASGQEQWDPVEAVWKSADSEEEDVAPRRGRGQPRRSRRLRLGGGFTVRQRTAAASS